MRRKGIALFLCILCMLYALTGCSFQKDQTVMAQSLKPVVLQEIKEAAYVDQISLSGNIKPAKTIKLAYKIPGGIIENIFVNEGDFVKKDDIIMQLDSYDYQLKVQAAESKWESSKLKMDSQIPSKINQAKAYLDLVEKNYERIKNLYEEGAVPTAKMDEIEAKYIEAKNKYQEALDAKEYTRIELEQAEAAKDSAQSNLKDTSLRSPIDGIVLKKIAEVGETAAQGYPVIVLGQLDEVEIEVGVADSNINNIKKGQKAVVYVYGIEKEFEGTVSEVSALADTQTRTFPVKVTIKNKDHELKPGMVGKVTIPLSEEKALLIPIDAILNMPEGPVVFVYSEKDRSVHKQKITPGEIIGDKLEVKEGLKVGDKIVVEGQFKLKDNDKINVEAMK
ncbi:efflux RND transporter periplasmic adaptor subunit [Crassaminicella indica]|uniref:Efflux RND transporter periplasmic adaptor subunit n=1 Tax=Crassaminicella indica TaxID=2855394 RepID=A0ABX8RES7_9CLOT|nr:efflux RND transporter periplasmic adaptor subunit [Crassaminicella indica]QXM06802.1 efflux RND transporter periplasmic adaptor subunit [Crassaminicella indica]